MMNDAALLRQYATTRSEPAFTELVERHLDVVYFAALRRCGGDAHSAEDVTQEVFTRLASNAASLANHPVLTGWLYVTTRNVAANLLRGDKGRRSRESEALAMNDSLTPGSAETTVDWDRIRPVLDGALDELGAGDRDAVLLRFFENRPFAEIGTALRLTEDAARMRVQRALDKLRPLLARRGITATSAALALALTQHAAQVKPVGLAASVAASAVAGSAIVAASVGVAGSSVALFTSAAKLGTSTLVATAALCASVVGNMWLLKRSDNQHTPLSSAVAAASPEANTVDGRLTVADLRRDDLTAARDRLRTMGASEAIIRGMLEGILRHRYRAELSARRAQRLDTGWWRERDFSRIIQGPVRLTPADDPVLFREMVEAPLERLLGPDPAEVAKVNTRYSFLPVPTRQELARLDADLALTTAMDVPSRYGGSETALKHQRAQLEEERAALLAKLPPQQQQEYELRFGKLASGLTQRMASIRGTEEEYRAVFEIVDARIKAGSVATDGNARRVSSIHIDQPTADQLVMRLGYDRALDYIWSGTYDYPAYARAVREANLPLSAASRTLQLAAETSDKASYIHFEADRSLQEKRAAIQALYEKTQAELDALLPPSVQQKLAPRSLGWLTELKEGRYKLITATLGDAPASVLTLGGSAIDQPTSGRIRPTQMLPRRSAGAERI